MFNGELQMGSIEISQGGVYTVETEVESCVSVRSEEFEVIITALGSKAQGLFSIYPNPAGKILNIVVPSDIIGQVDLKIYNSKGMYIKEDQISSGINQLDFESFPSGIYLLQMQFDKGYYNVKIKKE